MDAISVLTLQSTAPEKDAECICAALPFVDHRDGPAELESTTDSSLLTLQHATNESLLFLVPSDSFSSSIVYCLLDQTDLQRTINGVMMAQEEHVRTRLQTRRLDNQLSVAVLSLPSRARIILATPEVLKSHHGRQAISEWIQSSSAAEMNGVGTTESFDQRPPTGPPLYKQPRFRTLQSALMNKEGRFEPNFPLNAREPVEFETELFKGKILCVLRPENPSVDDPYWNERIFSHKKRRLVINLQGKFKYKPSGVVYAGAEISKPMKLGLVTRALAGVLLKLVDRFVSGVHSAFGDVTEPAHIVAPALGFFERIVVTPPGSPLPRLDDDIVESAESMAERKNTRSVGNWNTVDTYTFSFYSMNIDLPTWSLVGLPVSGDVSLTTFWGDSALKICMYEKLGSDRQHRTDTIRYVFALQLKYMARGLGAESEEEEEEDILRWSGRQLVVPDSLKVSAIRQSESQLFDVSLHELQDESDLESLFYDAEQPRSCVDLDQAQRMPSFGIDLLSAIDGSCPAWIELISSRGNYTKAFAVNVNGSTMLRSVDDCNDLLSGSAASTFVDNTFSSRLSSSERMRRMVGCAIMNPTEMSVAQDRLGVFQQRRRTFANEFMREDILKWTEKEKLQIKMTGMVFRAISDRHWLQELVKLTATRITFCHPDKKKKPNFLLNLSNIVEVARLKPEDCPTVSGQFFLVLRSIGRSVYLMFGSERDRERFLNETLKQKIVEGGTADLANSVDSESTSVSRLAQIDNPADEFLQKSTMWNCQRRRILNGGAFNFRHSLPSPNPMHLVEDALKQALESGSSLAEDAEQRRAFLDSAALLKQADVRDLSEGAKLAFFLNVYHLMIIHAYMVLGPPDWSLKWISYFNSIAYEVSDDIFSLVELEHCILRNKMSNPSQFMSRFVIPRSQYDVALTIQDFRINFALNCGSLSNPSVVIVYNEENLDQQLNLASRLYLESVSLTRRSGRKIILELPRVCEWFSADFGSTDEEMLRRLEPYLTGEYQKLLRSCRNDDSGKLDMSLITLRFQAYEFECRVLQLYRM